MIVRFRLQGGGADPRLPTAVEIGWPLRRGNFLRMGGALFEVREVVITIERRERGTFALGDGTPQPWSITDSIAADVEVLEVDDA